MKPQNYFIIIIFSHAFLTLRKVLQRRPVILLYLASFSLAHTKLIGCLLYISTNSHKNIGKNKNSWYFRKTEFSRLKNSSKIYNRFFGKIYLFYQKNLLNCVYISIKWYCVLYARFMWANSFLYSEEFFCPKMDF